MTTSDLPPAYNSLHTSTANIAGEEEIVPVREDDDEVLVNYSFQDKSTRLIFIQKVLTIKLLQLLGVILVISYFVWDSNWGNVYHFMRREGNYVHVFVLSTFAYAVIFGLLMYCDQARRTNPYRYMFLVAYPLSYTLLICFTFIWCDIAEISAAWYFHCAAVFALLVYSNLANQPKIDFETKYGILIAILVLIVMFAITVPCIYHPRYVFGIVYATIALGVDLVFLLFNLEKMTSKHYRTTITPDDFVDGAINLHIDFYYTIYNFIVPKVKYGFEKLSAELMIEPAERNETSH